MNKDLKKEKETKEAPQTEVCESEPEETKEEKLEKELAEKNDQFLRLYAEFDNFRKRSQKEREGVFSDAKAMVLAELLPVLDNFPPGAWRDPLQRWG